MGLGARRRAAAECEAAPRRRRAAHWGVWGRGGGVRALRLLDGAGGLVAPRPNARPLLAAAAAAHSGVWAEVGRCAPRPPHMNTPACSSDRVLAWGRGGGVRALRLAAAAAEYKRFTLPTSKNYFFGEKKLVMRD